MSNNFHFEIISSQDYENCIALTLAATNLPENPELVADEEYNQKNGLSLDNQVKFKEAGIDFIQLNDSARAFLENYAKQQGLFDKVDIVLDGNWYNSGFDTQADIAVKTDAWLEYKTRKAQNRLSRIYS